MKLLPRLTVAQESRSELPYTTQDCSAHTSRRASPIDPTPPTPSTNANFHSNQQQPSFRDATTSESALPPRPSKPTSATSHAEGETDRPGAESQISHYQTPNSSVDDHDPYMRGYSPQEVKEMREDKEERTEKRAPAESMFIQVGAKSFHFDRLAFDVEEPDNRERNSSESNDTLNFNAISPPTMQQSHHDSYPYLESGPTSPTSPRHLISSDYAQRPLRQYAEEAPAVPVSPTNASDYEGTVRAVDRTAINSIVAEKGSNSWTREDDENYRYAVDQRFSYMSPPATGIPPPQDQFASPPPSPTVANQLMRPPPTRTKAADTAYNYPQGCRNHQDSREGFYLPYESPDRQLRERTRSLSGGNERGSRALPSIPRGAVGGYSFVNLNRGLKTSNNKFDSSKELHSSPLAKSDNDVRYSDTDSNEGTPMKSGFFIKGFSHRFSKKMILITLGLIAILLGVIVGVVLGVEKGKQGAGGSLQADSAANRGNGNGNGVGLASVGSTTLPGGSVKVITLERTIALTATNILTKSGQTAVVTTTATSTLLRPPPPADDTPDLPAPGRAIVSPSAVASLPSATAPTRDRIVPSSSADAPAPTTTSRSSSPTAAPAPPRQTITQTICSYDGVTILGLRIGAFTTTLSPGDRPPFAAECTAVVRVSPRSNRLRARRLH